MEDKQKNEWQEREIGALWKNEGRNQTYLTGKVKMQDGTEQKVVIFSNKNKNKDSQPDFRVYKSEPKQQEETATASAPTQQEEELI